MCSANSPASISNLCLSHAHSVIGWRLSLLHCSVHGPREHMLPQRECFAAGVPGAKTSPCAPPSLGRFKKCRVPLHLLHPLSNKSAAQSRHLVRGWVEPAPTVAQVSHPEVAGWPHHVHAGVIGPRESPCSYQCSSAHPALSCGREHLSLLEPVKVRRSGGEKTWVPADRPSPHSPIALASSPSPLRSSPGGLRME